MDMESCHTQAVSIDGAAIRKIREEKRLTQLYVSKVVGVTTDTVSRWENNRYPTIRRDNALKLAEALEVEIAEILRQEDSSEIEAVDRKQPTPGKIWLWIAVGAVLSAILGYLVFQSDNPPPEIRAERILPPFAAPGQRVLIRVNMQSEKQLKGMILREDYPRGWTLIEAVPPASSLDNIDGIARWIFRTPQLQTTVAYMLEVARDAVVGTVIDLNGELIANPNGHSASIPLVTHGKMIVKPRHWADIN
ncbi:MAG: helix-turn-helix transcriptional regulator, partial [Desulfuromonadales bacterium]|nr:helix-turn-helix transcriptional regulator [Desulfuromonadales bacterium]